MLKPVEYFKWFCNAILRQRQVKMIYLIGYNMLYDDIIIFMCLISNQFLLLQWYKIAIWCYLGCQYSCSYLNRNEISISIWCQGSQVLYVYTFWITCFVRFIDEIFNDIFNAVDSSKYHSYNAKDAQKHISSNLYFSNHTIKTFPEN